MYSLSLSITQSYLKHKNKDELESVGKLILFYNDTIKVHN